RKEIENFLLVPRAIDRAINSRIEEVTKRTGKSVEFIDDINDIMKELSNEFKNRTQAQLQSHRIKFEKSVNPKLDESTIIEKILQDFDTTWSDFDQRLTIIPGKDFLSRLNTFLQEKLKITITHANIINAMTPDMVPIELKQIIDKIDNLRN